MHINGEGHVVMTLCVVCAVSRRHARRRQRSCRNYTRSVSSVQSPDVMRVDGGDHVGAVLQHHEVQGEGAARRRQRQIRPLKGDA